MAERESFESLLQALRLSWLQACEAAALSYQTALQGWVEVADDGRLRPRRVLIRPPPGAPAPRPQALEIDWLDLCRRRLMRPASLSLSFDCELRQGRDGAWHLHVVHPSRRRWWPARPLHLVEIVLDGPDDAGGEVRFDGQPWCQFGTRAGGRRP